MRARASLLAAALCCLGALAPAAAQAAAPAIGAVSATDLQGVSALLQGQVDPEGQPTSARFEYVDQAGFDQAGFAAAIATAPTPLGSGSAPRALSAAIAGLSPQTTYHYRPSAESPGGSASGPEGTFTTTQGFGFRPGDGGFSVVAESESGAQVTQAGSHPYALTTSLGFNLGGEWAAQPGVPFTDGDLRNLGIELPPDLIENPNALGRCTAAQFNTPRPAPSLSGESCPDKSQVGVVAVKSSAAGGETRYFGVFNLVPPPGKIGAIGFAPFGVPILLTPTIRDAQGSYGITLGLSNLSQRLDLYGLAMTVWGVPWAAGHDTERGSCLNEEDPASPHGKCSTGSPITSPPRAYLTLPTTCAAPMSFTATADSWQQPPATATFQSHDKAANPLALSGCNILGFFPVPSAGPSTDRASSSTGFDFNLDVSDAGITNPSGRAQSPIKRAVVRLPEGMTINPSVAAGLGVCTPAGYAAESASSPPGAGCPNDAKIGTVSVKSPLTEEAIGGSLYLAQPDDRATTAAGAENPFDSLLALYIIAKAPARGIIVKVAGRLDADPRSGRLTATFDDLPQLPYSHFAVHFREGQRSPLLSPPGCGTYATQLNVTPWFEDPFEPNTEVQQSPAFAITKGIGGGPCPPPGAPPFAPGAAAGTLNSNAGSYAPFYLHLTRGDQEQEITSYSARLAPGLLGKIAAVPFCPEAAIEAAKQISGSALEADPPCPAAAQIGHTVAGFGTGSVLAYAPGRLYLAGPYHGAPLSVVALDAATVGPFDLGTIVVRSAIRIDPQSAQVYIDSAGSDPIPHIIDGFPIRLRDIRIYIDRPGFTLNPTSCDPFGILSTLAGSGERFSDPGDDQSAAAPAHFQVSNCSSLGFRPRLQIRLKGATKRGDYPSFRAVYRPRGGDANVRSAQVTLPPSEFLAQNHIHGICTGAQLKAGSCPAGSIYGHAAAYTPLLDHPLSGPIYLRSSPDPLPAIAVSLQGEGIAITLEGKIDSSHGGVRGTFKDLPDAPVSKFVFALYGGRRDILVNSKSICATQPIALARLGAQNNKGQVLKPRLGAKCPGRRR